MIYIDVKKSWENEEHVILLETFSQSNFLELYGGFKPSTTKYFTNIFRVGIMWNLKIRKKIEKNKLPKMKEKYKFKSKNSSLKIDDGRKKSHLFRRRPKK